MPEPANEPGGPAVAEPPVIPAAPKVKTVPEQEQQTRLTPRYKVLIHNDDVTPMEFVVKVLQEIFKKSLFESTQIMLKAHFTGVALVTVLPLEEAELRIEQAHSMARPRKYPLTFTCEPE
ncbi:MAG TPA: ATP-dependent Clp protease adaptor ClpS [Planctomycetota bacterium]|nr:ATP-dependent Clp protease adaptor ClpS [Planctomycetota bacterium]